MLRAGAASVVITPPLGLTVQAATHQKRARWVRDELEANALYVAGDGDGIVLVSGDLAGMEPEQVARMIRELIGNDYVTGETVVVDGGLSMRIC